MDNDVRKRLEEKFGKNVRTGGKGTVRRKVKKKSRIVSTHISQEEKEYNQLVSKCNDKIQSIENNDEISLWNHHIRDCFFEFLEKSNNEFLRLKESISNDIVVDSPPGKTRPSRHSKSLELFTPTES